MSIASSNRTDAATFTLEHYEHMVDCGAFSNGFEQHWELLRGEISDKYTGAPARYTLEHYEHMISVGAFDEPYNIPVELLRGEIVMMSPIGTPHSHVVTLLTEWSYEVIADNSIRVRVQNPIRISSRDSEPEADLAWVTQKDYSQQHPGKEDVLLLIEVAESSLQKDRTEKLAVYAEAGIPDYWIVNLIDKQIEVYREPSGTNYGQKLTFQGDEEIHPLALPEAKLVAARLFGTQLFGKE